MMHWLLFIHKILYSSTCFEPQVLIFRRIQLYTCSIWQCHSLREFVVICRYTAWVRTDCRGKVIGGCLKTSNLKLNLYISINPNTLCKYCFNKFMSTARNLASCQLPGTANLCRIQCSILFFMLLLLDVS